MTLTNFYVIAAVANVLIFSLIYFLTPALRASLISEDRVMETLTVILFLAGFLLGVILTSRLRTNTQRLAYGVIPLIGLIGLLDELSFGERIFSLTMPTVEGVQIDGVHDVASLMKETLKHHGNLFIYAAILVVGGLFVVWATPRFIRNIDGMSELVSVWPTLRFLVIFVAFGVIATIIDLDMFPRRRFYFVEELAEFNGALALLFASLAIASSRGERLPGVTRPRLKQED